MHEMHTRWTDGPANTIQRWPSPAKQEAIFWVYKVVYCGSCYGRVIAHAALSYFVDQLNDIVTGYEIRWDF